MMRTRDDRGGALVLVLSAAALVAAIFFLLDRYRTEQREEFQSELRRLKAEQAASEAAKRYLLDSADSTLWLGPPLVWTNLPPSEKVPKARALILKKHARPGLSPLPDWHSLRRGGLETGLDAKTIRIDDESQPVIAVAGTAKIGLLEIVCRRCSPAFVSLNDLVLDELQVGADFSGTILLSSVAGAVMMGKIAPGLNWCGTARSSGPRIRLEAGTALVLGGQRLKNAVAGCDIPRDRRLWPRIQLLGGPP